MSSTEEKDEDGKTVSVVSKMSPHKSDVPNKTRPQLKTEELVALLQKASIEDIALRKPKDEGVAEDPTAGASGGDGADRSKKDDESGNGSGDEGSGEGRSTDTPSDRQEAERGTSPRSRHRDVLSDTPVEPRERERRRRRAVVPEPRDSQPPTHGNRSIEPRDSIFGPGRETAPPGGGNETPPAGDDTPIGDDSTPPGGGDGGGDPFGNDFDRYRRHNDKDQFAQDPRANNQANNNKKNANKKKKKKKNFPFIPFNFNFSYQSAEPTPLELVPLPTIPSMGNLQGLFASIRPPSEGVDDFFIQSIQNLALIESQMEAERDAADADFFASMDAMLAQAQAVRRAIVTNFQNATAAMINAQNNRTVINYSPVTVNRIQVPGGSTRENSIRIDPNNPFGATSTGNQNLNSGTVQSQMPPLNTGSRSTPFGGRAFAPRSNHGTGAIRSAVGGRPVR